MMKVESRNLFLFGCLVLLIGVVSGCQLQDGGGLATQSTPVPTLGSQVTLQNEGVLTCSTACSDQGQCGIAETKDNITVVLLNSGEPALQNHDMLFQELTPVQILESVDLEIVREVAAGEGPTGLSLTFYNVNVPDLERAGWVAGWCVRQP